MECANAYRDPIYEVIYRGKIFYLPGDSLRIEPVQLARLKSFSVAEAAQYKQETLDLSFLLWRQDVGEALEVVRSTKPQGIAILTASIYDMSEHTEGTGFKISYYNSTNKTIKYVTANYVGINAVKDPVKDHRIRSTVKTLKGIGPIEPDTFGSYSQEYAWMTDVVQSFKITSLKVQYMDGTTKTIKAPNKVWMNDKTWETLGSYFYGAFGPDAPQEGESVVAPAAK